MVAAIPAAPITTTNGHPTYPKNPSLPQEDLPATTRPPLIPSEKDNAGISRRPRIKEVTSRYLSPHNSSPSSSSSSSSSSTPSSRRFLTPRPSSPSPAFSSQSPAPKRSKSVDRTRPDLRSSNAASTEISNATRALCTTTRSLSVSFQGESFFYQTSKAKAATPNPSRKPTPERRGNGTPTTPLKSQSENSRPGDHHHRWPTARTKQSNPLTRSMDCKDPIFAAVRLLPQSMIFEEGRLSFDSADLSASSDTDSVSSGSNSGAQEPNVPFRSRVTPRGISVPARFWQETNSRLRRLQEPGTPRLVPAAAKKSLTLIDGPLSSPRCGPCRPSSPNKLSSSPSRALASPVRVRGGSTLAGSSPVGQAGNAPSILNFAAEVRRAKKGESRIEEAHLLRLYHNRHLQWRFANAKANASLLAQSLTAEKNLYNAWVTTSEMRDSITSWRIKLQTYKQILKLTSILKRQMAYLEEWSLVDREHSSSLSGAFEALKASTLRLPILGGARADIQDVKDAVTSAVDVMQAMGSSICSLLSKVDGTNYLISELAKVAALERVLLDQSKELLCTVAAMHVKQCSLRSNMLQLKREGSPTQL